MLVLARVRERVDLGVAVHGSPSGAASTSRLNGDSWPSASSGSDPHTQTPCTARLLDEELGARTVDRLGDARRVHREPGRVHLGQDDEPGTGACRGLDHRGEAREVRGRVLPHDVVLDRRDLHDDALLQAADRLLEDLEALAEGEAHERQAGLAVVVEHDVGDGDHAAPLGERSAEREAVGLAERRGCRW